MSSANVDLEEILSSNQAVFNWCLRSANKAYQSGRLNAAADWCSLAAYSAAFHGWFGYLASPALESLLLALGARLPEFSKQPTQSDRPRWLHVMTTAFEIGGHTNLVCRWMRNDGRNASHSVVVTDQDVPFPEKLRVAAESTGGQVTLLEGTHGQLAKAVELRKCASRMADVIVLHLHPQDVASVIAFSVPGDIPVCLMNHADHLFGTGVSIADTVIEFRELGQTWSRKYRGSNRSVILPLPLNEPSQPPAVLRNEWQRAAARSRIGVAHDSVMLLTVATPYKYRPVGEWDILTAAENILKRCPEAVIVAVGPTSDDFDAIWGEDRWRLGGRVKAVGSQKDMADYYASADVYLGSVPFASQTAVLEPGLLGIPCVPTPSGIPFGLDDPSLAKVSWPATMDEYARRAVELARDPSRRLAEGRDFAASIDAHHCGTGWMACLRELKNSIPVAHTVTGPRPVERLYPLAVEFWADFAGLRNENPIYHAAMRALSKSMCIYPHLDSELLTAVKLRFPRAWTFGIEFCLRRWRFQLGKARRRLLGY